MNEYYCCSLKKMIQFCLSLVFLTSIAVNGLQAQTTNIGSCATPHATLTAFSSFTNADASYTNNQYVFPSGGITAGTIISYDIINSGSGGSIGLDFSDSCRSSCISSGARTAKLFLQSSAGGCVMANGISPTTANANSVNWNNPEFTGLTPNTNYIVEVQTTIPAGCAIYAQNLTYYQIPAAATTSCSTCSTPSCPVATATGNTAATAHTNLITTMNGLSSNYEGGNSLTVGQSQTFCVPVTVPTGSTTLGFSQHFHTGSPLGGTCVPNPTDEAITYSLVPAGNCAAAQITPTRTNANSVSSGFNPEYDNVTPGSYTLCFTIKLNANSNQCDTVMVYSIGYYNVIPGAPPATTVTCPANKAFNKLNWPDAPTFPKFPTTGFNCKSNLDSIFQSPETVFDSGYVQAFPGFIMYMTGYSANTSVTLTVNGKVYDYSGPAAGAPGGNVINWGAFTGESIEWYLPAGASCSLNICDNTQPGMPYQIYDYTSGQMLTEGTACATTNCSTVNFTIGSPTMSWTLDGGTTGILDMHNGGAQLTSPGTLTPGTHTITYTYSNNAGCTLTNTETITVAGPKIAVTAPVNPPCGASTGGFTMTGSASTAPYTYSIDNGSTYTATNKPTTLAAGTYTVSTKDKNGCVSATTTVTLTSTGGPATTPITPATIALDCKTTSATFTEASTVGYTYAWGGPGVTAGGATNIATVNAAGTYTVTVTNGSCSSTVTATATLNNTQPTMSTVPALALSCATTSGSLTETATTTGAAAYAWAGPGVTAGAATGTATVNAAGTYTVTVTDGANGCTSTAAGVVTLNNTAPTPGAVAPLTLTCTTLSGSLTETATTTGAAAYAWAGPGVTAGAATGTATVNAAGTYTVTVTDGANGCTSTAAGVVTLNNTAPTPGAVAPLTLTCAQNTGQLSETPTAVSGTPSYSWSGPSITAGGTTASPTVGAAGNYTVTVTDGANGCTATAAGVVTLNGTPPTLAAVAPANLTCTVLSATLTETPTASIGTLSYSWTGPVGGITAGGTTASATVGAPGTYTVSVTDAANNCSTVTSVTVTQTPNNLALDTASTPANCSNLAGSATVTVTAGTPSAYTWSGAASTFTTATANNIGAGTYTVTVSDNNGCTKTAAVKVSQTPVAFSIAASQLQNFNCLFYGADTVVVTKGTVTTPVFAWSDGTSNQNDTALIPLLSQTNLRVVYKLLLLLSPPTPCRLILWFRLRVKLLNWVNLLTLWLRVVLLMAGLMGIRSLLLPWRLLGILPFGCMVLVTTSASTRLLL